MVDSFIIDVNIADKANSIILLLVDAPWGTWHFPATHRLTSSEVIRKLGNLENIDGEMTIFIKATKDLLSAVRILAYVPSTPATFKNWMDAIAYLCASPSTAEVLEASENALLRPLRLLLPMTVLPVRSDLMLSRTILSDGAQSAGRTPLEVSDLLASDYFVPACSEFPPINLSVDPLTSVDCRSIVDVVLSLRVLKTHVTSLCQCAVLGLLARSPNGARCVLIDLQWLVGLFPIAATLAVAKVALRTLYEMECNGMPGCLLPIETISSLRRLDLSPMEAVHLLPMRSTENAVCVTMFSNSVSSWNDPPQSVADLRVELNRRVPWLDLVKSNVIFYVTGSLLTECVAKPGGTDECIGDVDLFCLDEEVLIHLVKDVMTAMSCFNKTITITNKSISRYRLECGTHFTEKCDIYVNSVERVRTYHMPLVRSAYCWSDGIYSLFPSSCLALATGINVDFTYVYSTSGKNSFSVLERKLLSGFSLILTRKERYQMEIYMRSRGHNLDLPGYPIAYREEQQKIEDKANLDSAPDWLGMRAISWHGAILNGIT
jgi:hypothetical protein